MSDIHIALVGGGPRMLVTLNALQRALRRDAAVSGRVGVTVIDPRPGGVGCHDPNQPDYMFTNTLASQVTAFHPVASDADHGGWITGPSFAEWAARSGVRNCAGRFYHSDEGEPVGSLDYLPRSLLGQYLSWAFQVIVAGLPNAMKFRYRHTRALSVKRASDGFRIELGDGSMLAADYVFLASGHSTNRLSRASERLRDFAVRARAKNPDAAYFPNPYPVSALEGISPEARVAIQGMGLTAWDAIAELTEGRGGRYEERDGRLAYVPSGDEPKILLYSRNCLPSAARGINQKGVTGRHTAHFFTPQAIAGLRATRSQASGSEQLDFQMDVLPLLKREMAYAYRVAETGKSIDPEGFAPTPDELNAIDLAFDPFRNRRFDGLADYRSAFLAHIREDLAEADRGNLTAPIKAATDVIRDCRAAICAAVEFRGLTPGSERWFRTVFVPIMNRIAFGPPKFRNHQLLAMFDAGIVDLAAGPNSALSTDEDSGEFILTSQFDGGSKATSVDALVVARLDVFLPEVDENPLTRSLLSEGLIRPYRNGAVAPGGCDITPDHEPIGRDGRVMPDLWITGIPTEGAIFYTHALPRAGLPSGQHRIAERCVSRMMDRIRIRRSARTMELVE